MDRIATPGATRGIIKKYDIKVRKTLGQNFLIEKKFIDKIIAAAELDKEQVVVEIGPGVGGLTQALVEAAGHVIALEIDQALVKTLQDNFNQVNNLTVIHGDALKVDFEYLTKEIPAREQFAPGYKIVANLPYYISTPLVMRVLKEHFKFLSMVLMVQKEVARRMQALPGTKDYGSLSIGIQYYCRAKIITQVPNTVFFPRPEVESAVIKLEKRDQPAVNVQDEKMFFALVRAAFSQRRKTMVNALSNAGLGPKDKWERILEECEIDPKRRGETLSIEEFARVSNLSSLKR